MQLCAVVTHVVMVQFVSVPRRGEVCVIGWKQWELMRVLHGANSKISNVQILHTKP